MTNATVIKLDVNRYIAVPVSGIAPPSPNVWFIHGASATPKSFNYIKDELSRDSDLNNYLFKDIVYDCQDDLLNILRNMINKAPRDTPLYLVGHSLGGVLAAAMTKVIQDTVTGIDLKGVVTLASPLGGSDSANILKWIYPKYNLFKNISTANGVIRSLKGFNPSVPFVSVVTSSGNNPLFPTANDGVVTVLSQTGLTGVTYVEMDSNHFEVLVNPDTTSIIKSLLIFESIC
jgi:triacylglycerol esterase/lipase EstA (alpha/beta hydrolase family)